LSFTSTYEEDLFRNRYARLGTEKTWDDVFRRVTEYVTPVFSMRQAYQDLMTRGIFLPSSPQLFNFGVPGAGAGSSCYVYPLHDTLESIWHADEVARDVYRASGGVGFDLSELRPRGAEISASPNPSVGVLSVAERLNLTTEYITAGGRARGALMLQLECTHPDLVEFVYAKCPLSQSTQAATSHDLPLTQCNMSVRCSDEFMSAAQIPDAQWPLSWESRDSSRIYVVSTWEEMRSRFLSSLQVSPARFQLLWHRILEPALSSLSGPILASQLWEMIVYNAWHHADPGVVFSSHYEAHNTTPQKGTCCSNPCGEFIAPAPDSCNLGSLNLSAFAGSICSGDFAPLEAAVRVAIHYLNDVLRVNQIPVPDIASGNRESRRVGLGFFGLHDLLIQLGYSYSSPEARDLASCTQAHIAAAAWETSFQLGEDKALRPSIYHPAATWELLSGYAVDAEEGSPLLLPWSKSWRELSSRFRTLATRARDSVPANVALTSVAPTGSLAQVAGFLSGHQGFTSGLEPVPWWEHTREDRNGTTKVVHWSRHLLHPAINPADECATGISPEAHVLMQAAVSTFVDMSVSKTINLPNSASPEDVAAAYLLAWKKEVTGTTVYRDGSKPSQVLSPSTTLSTSSPSDPAERPVSLPGETERVVVDLGGRLGKVNVYITLNCLGEHPYEVFFQGVSHKDLDPGVSRELDTVSRLVSLCLRYGVPTNRIVKQLEQIDGQYLYSLPLALAKLLSRWQLSKDDNSFYCRVCRKFTEHQLTDGCRVCMFCQTSAC
jgi:ribonucleoside-diphosphate reductase alpha chain